MPTVQISHLISENPPRLTDEQKLARLDAMTPEEIERNALEDPDNPPFTEEELERLSIAAPIQLTRRGLGLTQEEFAARFHIGLARLRDWEQGRYKPDSAALAYLKVIARETDAVLRALGEEQHERGGGVGAHYRERLYFFFDRPFSR
jgi:putative transcriptional regulator